MLENRSNRVIIVAGYAPLGVAYASHLTAGREPFLVAMRWPISVDEAHLVVA